MVVGEPAYDATSFARIFPHAKMLGFYAGGEIGPKALAGAPASRATQVGRAAMQGFTAVFGLFMVPQRTERAAPLAHVDAAAVGAAYVAARAARTPPPPPAGTLSRERGAAAPAASEKEARRAPAAPTELPPRPPRPPRHRARRTPPQPRGDERWAQTPPSLGSCAR